MSPPSKHLNIACCCCCFFLKKKKPGLKVRRDTHSKILSGRTKTNAGKERCPLDLTHTDECTSVAQRTPLFLYQRK